MKNIIIIGLLAMLFAPQFIIAQGCSEGGTDDGVKVIGYVQSEYQYQFLGDSVQKSMNGLDAPSSFYLNRARLGVTGNIPYDFSYYFLAEFSPSHGGPYILDAFVTYKRWAPYLKISMGQFKSQFGLELTTACSGLYAVNRSRVVNELASPFRDMGIILMGGTGEKKILGMENENIFQWRLAFTNGQGLNSFDGNTSKDFTGRLIFSPIDGIALGGSFRYGKQKPIQVGLVDDTRRRYGFDLSINKYNFLLQGEYINGYDKGSSLVGGGCGSTPTIQKGNFTKDGYWVALMYTFNERLAPIIKYQSYSVTSDVTTLPDQTQQEYIVGLNYYFNDWTRFQVNYVMTKDNLITDTPDYAKNYLVIQIQAKFN